MLRLMQPDLRDGHAPAIPPGLADLLSAAGCPPGAPPAAQRAALEDHTAAHPEDLQALDPTLLRLRALELADGELPVVVGEVRRHTLLAADEVSTTWLGWHVVSGARAALRCLRPAWRREPVVLRRVERGLRLSATVPGLAPALFAPHDPWPHVRWLLPGTPLADLLPAEDPPAMVPFARWLASALETLAALHARGLRFGALDPTRVLLADHRAFLLWLDPFDLGPGDPRADLAALTASLRALDPAGLHPLTQLTQPWIAGGPATAAEAARMVQRALADELLAARHRLMLLSRNTARGERAARLYQAVLALGRTLPPPAGRSCLHAGQDRALVLVQSDGCCVRGGRTASLTATLPLLYAPERGLDAAATRAVLRAGALAHDGDEALRAEVQARWPGDEAGGAALSRWLAAASRLRAAQLLLAYRLRRA
ncbi:MAG: hypothetical protein ABIO70_27405 [Pseudomonadota bacterium]